MTLEEAWPLPAVIVAQHITYDGHPDSYPMHVLAKVLSDGNSSRIYKSLVYDQGLAVAAFGGANLIENPNLFFAVAIVNPGQSLDAVEKALVAELEKSVAAGITDRELQRAKNQFARDYILGRETVQQKAGVLAHAEVLHADITTADGEFAIFQNMTREPTCSASPRRISRRSRAWCSTCGPRGRGPVHEPPSVSTPCSRRSSSPSSCWWRRWRSAPASSASTPCAGRPSGRRGRCRPSR